MIQNDNYVHEWCEKLKSFGLSEFPENVINLNEKSFLLECAKYVASSERCQDLSWPVAHHILSLCCHFLKHFESADMRNVLCSLLEACIFACSDVDVQDRSRMYLALLHTLSANKLKELVDVPGPGLTSLISEDGELQLASSVKHLNQPVLILLKQCTAPCTVSSTVTTITTGQGSTHLPTPPQVADIVKAYYDELRHGAHAAVDIPCKVKRTGNCTADVQAVALYLRTAESWGAVDHVMVGHLSKEADGHVDINIRCFPAKPFPVEMAVSAEFSIENVFHTCHLSSLSIHFSDFFKQLPVPEQFDSCKGLWRCAVFAELWSSLGERGYSAPYVDRCSNTWLPKLSKYIITEDADEDEQLAIIFLPPEYHLLLKIKQNVDSAFMEIRTDIILLLTYFNKYLKMR